MIVVGTTLAAFAMERRDRWASWLTHARHMIDMWPEPVQFFASLQVDARGIDPFAPLIDWLDAIGGRWWTYSLDDGRTEVTTGNRLRHITFGQNLVNDWAMEHGASHLLFLAADLEPDPDAIPKLTEVGWPIVGGHCDTYCLDGPTLHEFMAAYPAWTDAPMLPQRLVDALKVHMATAAFVLLERQAFTRVRWRYDLDRGMTDDPCLHHDCLALGWPTLVRWDCVGLHHPRAIGAAETRYTAEERRVHR